jgi:hypothetical protein
MGPQPSRSIAAHRHDDAFGGLLRWSRLDRSERHRQPILSLAHQSLMLASEQTERLRTFRHSSLVLIYKRSIPVRTQVVCQLPLNLEVGLEVSLDGVGNIHADDRRGVACIWVVIRVPPLCLLCSRIALPTERNSERDFAPTAA